MLGESINPGVATVVSFAAVDFGVLYRNFATNPICGFRP